MMFHFDQFENQIKIQGNLVLQTPLHIGGGDKDYYGVNNSVVKTFDDLPYIPGSSLKGSLRSFIERLAQSGILEHEEYQPPCIYGTMCLSQYSTGKDRENLLKEVGEAAFQDRLAESSCPICHLFGNQLRAAKVRINDATLSSEWHHHFDIRQGVGIDRDTGIAVRGALYDFEVVPAGTAFRIQLTAENLTILEKKWLLIGLEALRQGRIPLGGKLARGLGEVYGDNWTVTDIEKDQFLEHLLSDESHVQPYEAYTQNLLRRCNNV